MQPVPRPLSEQPLGEPPLPPATTRHVEFTEPAEGGTLAAPFLTPTSQHHAPASDTPAQAPGQDHPAEATAGAGQPEPLPWEEPLPPVAESGAHPAWDGVPTVEPESFQVSAPGAEPLMPWEEYLSLGDASEAAVSAETAPEIDDLGGPAPRATDEPPPTLEPWAALAPAEPDWTLPPAELETGEATPAWGDEIPPAEPAGFPLDAFIVPSDAHRPSGMEEGLREQAEALAVRLEALAARLRVEGFIPLVRPAADAQPIDQLIATLLAGYISR